MPTKTHLYNNGFIDNIGKAYIYFYCGQPVRLITDPLIHVVDWNIFKDLPSKCLNCNKGYRSRHND